MMRLRLYTIAKGARMTIEEIIGREFSIAENGIILDDMGNEWRDEDGSIVIIKGEENE